MESAFPSKKKESNQLYITRPFVNVVKYHPLLPKRIIYSLQDHMVLATYLQLNVFTKLEAATTLMTKISGGQTGY
jgi:hypothetical protein